MAFTSFPPLEIPRALQHLALAGWLGAIAFVIVFSLVPHLGPPGEYDIDKLCHAIAYGISRGHPLRRVS